jgi:hypothetical protein
MEFITSNGPEIESKHYRWDYEHINESAQRTIAHAIIAMLIDGD